MTDQSIHEIVNVVNISTLISLILSEIFSYPLKSAILRRFEVVKIINNIIGNGKIFFNTLRDFALLFLHLKHIKYSDPLIENGIGRKLVLNVPINNRIKKNVFSENGIL